MTVDMYDEIRSLSLVSNILLSAQSAEAGTGRLQLGVVCIAISLLLERYIDVQC